MESLTSPKITVGVHCLRIRTKRMYVASVVDPAESTFYDPYEASAYWCVDTHERLRSRWPTGPAGRVLRRNEGAANYRHPWCDVSATPVARGFSCASERKAL